MSTYIENQFKNKWCRELIMVPHITQQYLICPADDYNELVAPFSGYDKDNSWLTYNERPVVVVSPNGTGIKHMMLLNDTYIAQSNTDIARKLSDIQKQLQTSTSEKSKEIERALSDLRSTHFTKFSNNLVKQLLQKGHDHTASSASQAPEKIKTGKK